MGEVYKARDTRLDRIVAVKILSADISASSDARQRFEREARTISQLSHPHICALFDVGHQDGIEFLVMELLDGETLADRLARGALPIAQVIRCATQIADALDKAHRQGIVHRDLKPANVMLTKAGVKLLDFGLAKPARPLSPAAASIATMAASPPLTDHGMIAGTIHYMAPEQLEGRPADARSDIYAFGAVIYEMATGTRAFRAAMQPLAPAALDRLVRTCLAADPDERWQSAHDVGLQLAAIDADRSSLPERAPAPRGVRRLLPWAIAAIALVLAAGSWLRPRENAAPLSSPIRFPVAPPPGGAFSDTVETICIALSPDGTQLAYVAADAGGARRVWLRALSAVDARPVPGTEGARAVIWSLDGRSIAFFAADKLKRLDVPDGAPVTVSDVPDVRVSGTWGDGQILFSAVPGGIFRVPAGGGPPVLERAIDRARGEINLQWPSFLPDGKRYLYLMRRADGSGMVMVAELGKPGVALVPAVSAVQYVDPGYILFARDGRLLAQRFDASASRMVGDAFPVAEPIRYFYSTGAATFTASRTGALVYQAHTEKARLTWLDRTGKELGAISEAQALGRVRISPDGTRVLFDRATPNLGTFDVWQYDLARGVEQRLTTERLSENGPLWLPGGFVMFSGGAPPHLMRLNLATGTQEEILHPPSFSLTEDVSPDGKTFLFTQRTVRGNFDLWTVPLGGAGAPAPLLETPFDEMSARFSPDGRHIAFASDESGRYEIYVAPFPLVAGKTRVSAGGGNIPRWSRDGRELFYLSGDLHLVAVPVRSTPSLVFGTPQGLFPIQRTIKWDDAKNFEAWPDFDVSPDGTKFLAIMPQPANHEALTAVLNWPREHARP
jgi:Tol biopolymer transport system component